MVNLTIYFENIFCTIIRLGNFIKVMNNFLNSYQCRHVLFKIFRRLFYLLREDYKIYSPQFKLIEDNEFTILNFWFKTMTPNRKIIFNINISPSPNSHIRWSFLGILNIVNAEIHKSYKIHIYKGYISICSVIFLN